MNYSKINITDIANGPGVRVSLFVSGCRNRCPGCFNPETWDFNHGEKFTLSTISNLLSALDKSYISGLTILGGDPLEPENLGVVTQICKIIKTINCDKTIWIYTGYTYENFKDIELLKYVDVVVDGKFIESQKDISLQFRGSKNQRIIDIKATKSTGDIEMWITKTDKI
ncbi:anaerobic ribonucleoside-triphosphate reductase activating protein [Peptostreptococcus sp. D1]|uniref:anaerobic ribonucleoside-triphosphate reductase activating protein n=1 Tax=Peptostreptococcus sp. D1 TaxID=72304 RepID=UPI0008E616A7|nr:anaerobic ribonucleoside-triphosphate reductase activating protein [Peptostreptococcus sp. D1]SFE84296.1 anaerobic ribonucleoside-triphosphate reductase activating protein [Peptostreptococcus sp. D1]